MLNQSPTFFSFSIGAIAFGLPDPHTLAVAAGSSTIIWGGLQVVLYMMVSVSVDRGIISRLMSM